MEATPSSHMDMKAKIRHKARILLLRGHNNGVIAPSAMLKIAKEIDAKRKQTLQLNLEENIRVS